MAPKDSKSPVMDPGIWSQLPPEILELVLSFIPLKSLLNLRSTCKHFNSLVFSSSFMSKHSNSSSSSPFSSFLLLSHRHLRRSFSLYDSTHGCWSGVSLSFSSLKLPSASGPLNLLSASNGLFCFCIPNSFSFIVCNLLAKSWRVIEFPSRPFDFELLTLISTPSGFKIFTANSNSTFLFDSKIQSWNRFKPFDPLLTGNHHQEGVDFNGSLYFITPEPFSMVSFSLETGKWERPRVSDFPSEVTFVRLVSDNGDGNKNKNNNKKKKSNLYLVGGIGENGVSRGMKVWELRGVDWVEIETLPEFMCRKFMSVCYHNYEHVYCFWHQGLICVCCYNWPEILYYKVSRGTWHWIPKCPSLPDKWSCGFRWFSFVPEFYAPV